MLRERQNEIEGEEGVAWIKCMLCDDKRRALACHLTTKHKITVEEYLEKFPGALLTSQSSKKKFKVRSKNFDWINRANERGEDLTEYKQKMGEAVRQSIMSNPEERKRRAEQLAKNNKTSEARQRSSEAAKQTSARPEIAAARAEKLAIWRKENYEEFYEKCIKSMHSCWFSKPELALFAILREIPDYNFRHNQIVKSEKFANKSQRKQIDIADKQARFYVEFDGIRHFKQLKNQTPLEVIQTSDKLLDEHIIAHNWTLVRISCDQFSYKNGGEFNADCLIKLFELIKNPQPGVFYIGEMYNEQREKTII